MKTYKLILTISIASSLLLFGCPYEAKFPLSNPNESKIDTNFVGNWNEISTKNDEPPYSLDVNIFNDHEYIAQMMTRDKGSLMIQGYRVFETTLYHQKFLNVQEIGNKPKYKFYKYSISADTLRIAAISKDSIKVEFNNREELEEYILKNINKEKFYEKEMVLVKRKK
jgi:hypothetical protein